MLGIEKIRLDYARAATPDLLTNLSGCAFDGKRLWTVSDEGGSLEQLVVDAEGFRLVKRYDLRELVPAIPGEPADELDLESIDAVGGRLHLCGSHCRVRRKPEQPDTVNPALRDRRSRRLLARFDIDPADGEPRRPRHLPFTGDGSLRRLLEGDAFLGPFLDLPSKENGFDVEGLTVRGGRVLLGLRGPLLDGVAVAVDLDVRSGSRITGYRLHFLDLHGLAVRELARVGEDVAIIAGPVGDAKGPFELFRWRPRETPEIQTVLRLHAFGGGEKPEGCCALPWRGRDGLLVLFDSPAGERLDGTAYMADWIGPA